MNFKDVLTFNAVLKELKGTLEPFALQNTETDTGIPPRAMEMGFNGQTGDISEPENNRGVSGIQIKRSFYNIFLRTLTAGLPVLVEALSNLYTIYLRDYCSNDRKYSETLRSYYKDNDVTYVEEQGRFLHRQLQNGVWKPLTLLHDRGKTQVGIPSVWPGSACPSWAIDIGTHITYSWSDCPVLNNDLFKSFIAACADFGASYDTSGFTAPDLRGISPGLFSENTGMFLASSTGQHSHSWGDVAVSVSQVTAKHSHNGELWHEPHRHTCTPRAFVTVSAVGRSSWCGENKTQTKEAHTSSAGEHTHTVSFASGTEKHWHTTGPATLTAAPEPSEHLGVVTRVDSYPVTLIVRIF